MDIYEKIRQLAQEKKISIRQLEEQTKIGNGVVGKWRTSTPGIDKVQKVADYFNVSVDYLLGREDIEKPKVANLEDDDIVFAFDGHEVTPEEKAMLKSMIEAYRKNK